MYLTFHAVLLVGFSLLYLNWSSKNNSIGKLICIIGIILNLVPIINTVLK